MSLWKNRPLFTGACGWMGSALLGFFLEGKAKLAVILVLAVTFVILGACLGVRLLLRRKPCFGLVLFVLGCMMLSLLSSYVTFDQTEKEISPYVGKESVVTATVDQCRSKSGSFAVYVLDVSAVEGNDLSAKALLTCYGETDLDVGDHIQVSGPILSIEDTAGEFYETYQLLCDGIFFGIEAESHTQIEILGSGESSLWHDLAEHRKGTAAKLAVSLGKDTAGVVSALFLGEKSYLPQTARRDFARCGVSHLLAISGLHMTILFGTLAWLLSWIGLHPKVRGVLLLFVSVGYLFYLGFPPSATRAVVMLGFVYLSTLLSRKSDPLTSLGIAGMGILMVSPTAVADVGFWLSFSATFGLLTLLPWIRREKKTAKSKFAYVKQIFFKIGKGLAAGVVAVSVSLWIIAPVFGQVSLFSAPMTLVLTPVVGILLFLTPLYLLLGATPVGQWLATVIQTLTGVLTESCAVVGDSPYALLSLRGTWVWVVALLMLMGTLVLLGLTLSDNKKWLIFTPILTGWIVIFVCLGVSHVQNKDVLAVDYVTPSTISDMVVYTHGNESVICDFSNGSKKSLFAAVEKASDRGATEISALIMTHYHSAMSGSLLWILEGQVVRELWLPEPTDEDDHHVMLSCIEKATKAGTTVCMYTYGDDMTIFDSCLLRVDSTYIKRSVQPVLLMTLKTPTQSMIYHGGGVFESDLAETARDLVQASDVVLFGRHGPKLKAPLSCTFSEDVTLVCLADNSVAEYLPQEDLPEVGKVLIGNCQFNLYGLTCSE